MLQLSYHRNRGANRGTARGAFDFNRGEIERATIRAVISIVRGTFEGTSVRGTIVSLD
jgi:hypothetical protein